MVLQMDIIYKRVNNCYNLCIKLKRGIFMKKMKKVLAIVLAVVISLSCMSIVGFAAKRDTDYAPTIIIPGLFQCETYSYENGEIACDANGVPLAAPFYVSIGEKEITDIVTKALLPIIRMFISQEDKDQLAAKEVSKILAGILMGRQRSDANGEFIDDVRPQVYEGSFATLTDTQREHVLRNFPIEEYFEIAGEENLYVFNYVSTGNMIDTVEALYDYIQFVKKDSGSSKVNIVPVSQGGSIANGLMKYYDENDISLARDINRIVFVVPALDGAALIGDSYRYGFTKDTEVLYNTMMPSLVGKENYLSYIINIAMRLMPNADVNNLLDVVVDTLVNDYLRYSTLMWGLCPSGDYEFCRDKYLSEPQLAEIRRQADWYYDAQLNSESYILKAKFEGVKIFDIVDTNVTLYQLAVSHDKTNADGMIHLSSTSMGAYSVGVNQKLPDDYVPERIMCLNPFHNHDDPEGIVDARAGLLPDTTFYFSGQNHADTASNDVIMSLIIHLLTDESFTSVFSYSYKFPQFNYGRNTKQLRIDLKAAKEIDKSTLSSSDATELDAAIKQAEEMLTHTVVNVNEVEEATTRFYAIYDKIVDGANPFSTKKTNKILYFITENISTGLYNNFGSAAFSEMPMLIIEKIIQPGIVM